MQENYFIVIVSLGSLSPRVCFLKKQQAEEALLLLPAVFAMRFPYLLVDKDCRRGYLCFSKPSYLCSCL